MGLFGFGKKKVTFAEAPAEARFVMPIKDVFYISGVGTVILGTVERGSVSVCDIIEITSGFSAEITDMEKNYQKATEATEGEKVGLVLMDVARGSIKAGEVAYII